MKIVIRKFAIIVIVVFVLRGLALGELTISQIAKRYSPSVVTIVALDENDQPLSLGSGFFINKTGDIATNHHVLEGSVKAIIKILDGQKGEVIEIIKDDPKLDLLIARTSMENTTSLPFGDSDTVIVGEDIIVIGNPAGLEGTISKGIISGIRKAEGIKFIQLTAAISPGSSGGPVFNLSGKVIGVATAYLDFGQNLNFAMPVNYLKNLKTTRIRLASLPKMTTKLEGTGRDKTLVEGFDVYYGKASFGSPSDLGWIDFSIRNQTNYTIKNIKLLFVYKNSKGEVISYSAEKFGGPILPKLALQFQHVHRVYHFFNQSSGKRCTVEIRILDYEIDKGTPFSLDKGRFHEVRPEDSLYRIAQQYGISVEELCRLNHITPNQVIDIGQKLLVAP